MGLADLSQWYEAIMAAHSRISSYLIRTPLFQNEAINHTLGFRLIVKPESLQKKTGSFKTRGALHYVRQSSLLTEVGFVACSCGNHAQGLAFAAHFD